MKKNKTIAYMLAAALLVGGTFLGTKALFTDKVDTVGELAISTGDVDIEVTETSKWTLSRNGAEIGDGTTVDANGGNLEGTLPDEGDKFATQKPLANNLKPGDVLTKKVTVKNVGTLMATLNLAKDDAKMATQLGDLSGLIDASNTEITISDTDKNELLSPGEEATFTLTLAVKNENSVHGTGHNTDIIENTKVELSDAWVLTATQQDPKDAAFGQNN